MLIVVGLAFVSFLLVLAPDALLAFLLFDVVPDPPVLEIEVNFGFVNIGPIGIRIPLVVAFAIAPALLITVTLYLHAFLDHWESIGTPGLGHILPTIFNLPNLLAKSISDVIFYWLTPATLIAINWKMLPMLSASWASWTILITAVVTAFLIWLKIRRNTHRGQRNQNLNLNNPGRKRRYPNPIFLGAFVVSAAFAVVAGWQVITTEYVKRSEIPGFSQFFSRLLDLSQAKLGGKDLRGLDLTNANLREANLKKSNLKEAILRNANLIGAKLDGARLVLADMAGANLNSASLIEAQLGASNLKRADFTLANLSKANLACLEVYPLPEGEPYVQCTNMAEAKFRRAILTEADLRGANLQGADLRDADLRDAELGCILVSDEPPEKRCTDLRGTKDLGCKQLGSAKDWQSAYRDDALACRARIPVPLEE